MRSGNHTLYNRRRLNICTAIDLHVINVFIGLATRIVTWFVVPDTLGYLHVCCDSTVTLYSVVQINKKHHHLHHHHHHPGSICSSSRFKV